MQATTNAMKTILTPLLVALPAMFLLTGCLDLSLGGGSHTTAPAPTLGQQLIDLQTARNSGAISEAEYQLLRTKLIQKN
jgi:hypothetical protein